MPQIVCPFVGERFGQQNPLVCRFSFLESPPTIQLNPLALSPLTGPIKLSNVNLTGRMAYS
jgi:hypothetical protein